MLMIIINYDDNDYKELPLFQQQCKGRMKAAQRGG